MEDFQLDIVIGKGPTARSIRLDLPRFTLVGATTRTGLITGPLRDRFGFVARLDYYDADDLATIVDARRATILGVALDAGGAREIALAEPRHAAHREPVAEARARLRGGARRRHGHARRRRAALGLFEVDELGLDKVDRAILERALPHVRGPGGGARHAGGRGGGGARDRRRRVRAVPAAVWPARTHAPGPGRDRRQRSRTSGCP